jgi:hypothetical protein
MGSGITGCPLERARTLLHMGVTTRVEVEQAERASESKLELGERERERERERETRIMMTYMEVRTCLLVGFTCNRTEVDKISREMGDAAQARKKEALIPK